MRAQVLYVAHLFALCDFFTSSGFVITCVAFFTSHSLSPSRDGNEFLKVPTNASNRALKMQLSEMIELMNKNIQNIRCTHTHTHIQSVSHSG